MKKIPAALAALALAGGMVALSAAPAQAATIPSTEYDSVWTNWDTRPAGHYAYVDGGLHVWTDYGATGSPDPRKVSLATPLAAVPLSEAGMLAVDYTNIDPSAFAYGPGLNLVVDFDGIDGPDGTLVYEAVYGQDLWLTGGSEEWLRALAPSTTGGNGSAWHGTIAQWVETFPDAKVHGLAFALGSGVNANGVIHSISAFGDVYTFDLADPEYRHGALLGKGQWYVESCSGNVVTQARELHYAQEVSYDGGETWEATTDFVTIDYKIAKKNKNTVCS